MNVMAWREISGVFDAAVARHERLVVVVRVLVVVVFVVIVVVFHGVDGLVVVAVIVVFAIQAATRAHSARRAFAHATIAESTIRINGPVGPHDHTIHRHAVAALFQTSKAYALLLSSFFN